MSNALVVSQPGSLLPADNEFEKMLRMAGEFAQSGILPKGIPPKPAAVLYIVQTGYELGIPPGAALRMISLVEGKPTLDAQMQRALIYRDHGDDAFRFVESDATRCTVEYKRKGWQTPARFTLTMAEIAPDLKKKFNWQSYPANMLRARATTFVANMAFSDSTLGLYAADELIEATGGDVEIGADGEPHVLTAHVERDAAQRAPGTAGKPIEQPIRATTLNSPRTTAGKATITEIQHLQAVRKTAGWSDEDLYGVIAGNYPEAVRDGKPSVRELTSEQIDALIYIIETPIEEDEDASVDFTEEEEAAMRARTAAAQQPALVD